MNALFRVEEGHTVRYGFVAEVAIFGDASPSGAEQELVRQSRELVGVGLLHTTQVLITDGGAALEFHGGREHEHSITRERESLVVLRRFADASLGEVAALGEGRGQRLTEKRWDVRGGDIAGMMADIVINDLGSPSVFAIFRQRALVILTGVAQRGVIVFLAPVLVGGFCVVVADVR
mmetsp:Transcript_26867/g.39590  ORF Transcript_26867/g.39590 Transcript_26867/m.39590 type:complete len:177 (-) Transcript_26867:382-912(-)